MFYLYFYICSFFVNFITYIRGLKIEVCELGLVCGEVFFIFYKIKKGE